MDEVPRTKRPVIAVIAAGFFAYAGLIPVLFLLVRSELAKMPAQTRADTAASAVLPAKAADISWPSLILICLTLAACIALLIPGRARWVFHFSRMVLGCWLLSALIALAKEIYLFISAPLGSHGALPANLLEMLVAAALVALLFGFFSFGRACRVYYGLPLAGRGQRAVA